MYYKKYSSYTMEVKQYLDINSNLIICFNLLRHREIFGKGKAYIIILKICVVYNLIKYQQLYNVY